MPTINTSTLTTINKDTDGVWTSTTCTAAIDYDGDITDGDPCKFASSGVYRDQNGAGDCFYCSGYTQTEVRTLVHEDSSTTTQTTVYAKILLQFEEEGGSAVSDKYIYYGGGRTFGTLPTNTTRAGYTLAG